MAVVGIVILIGAYFVNQSDKADRATIKNDSFESVAVIEKLKRHSSYSHRKYRSRYRDIVYFYFVKNDTVFHKITFLKDKEIDKLGLQENQTFYLRVGNNDYDVFDVSFRSPVDTIIDKRLFEVQIYETGIHRRMVE